MKIGRADESGRLGNSLPCLMRPGKGASVKVAIGIPAYNAENYLRPTLDSVRAQTYRNWELILVDDGSRDSTACIAEDYAARDPRIGLVRQPNGGLSAARNRAYREMPACAEAIIFLDSDDVWEPNALATLAAALEAAPMAVAAHGIADYIDGEGRPLNAGWFEDWCRDRRELVEGRLVCLLPEAPTTYAALAYRQCIATPGVVLIRRAALETVGPFDPGAKASDDWDMWLRLSALGDLAFVNKTILGYRRHAGNMSDNRALMREGELYIRRKLLASPQLNAEQRRLAALGYRLSEQETCRFWLRHARESLTQREMAQAARRFCRAARHYAQSLRGISA